MDKKTYSKMFNKKVLVIGTICLSILESILLGYAFYGLGSWWIPVIGIFFTSLIFNYYFLKIFMKNMGELSEYYDNLILFDRKFIPQLVKQYKKDIFRSRIDPFRIANYELSIRKPIIIMVLICLLGMNIVIIYFALISPGYDFLIFLLQMFFFTNIIFISLPLSVYIIFILFSPTYSRTNFSVITEDELLIFSQYGQYIMKNGIPLDNIKKVKLIKKTGNRSSKFNRTLLVLDGKFDHPEFGLYCPTLKSLSLVKIEMFHPIKILQRGRLVGKKNYKQYEYITTNKVIIEPKKPEEMIIRLTLSLKDAKVIDPETG